MSLASLTPALLTTAARGYRSNRVLDIVTPDGKSNKKMFWSLQYEGPDCLLGGAAGGAKSHTLLSMALQYVDVPGYAALLIREQFTDLSQPGGLMHKAITLLEGIPGVKKVDGGKRWEFETHIPGLPAILQFGHLGHVNAEFNYKGGEYQFVGIDEATEIAEAPCLYLKSRLRRVTCPRHRGLMRPDCKDCQRLGPLSKVPLRFRPATNPGGKFGEWVKNRYVPKEYLAASPEVQFNRLWDVELTCPDCGGNGRIPDEVDKSIIVVCPFCMGFGKTVRRFIPARLIDNPYIDRASYIQSLKGMENPVEVARLLGGRWDVMTEGQFFKEQYFRHYSWQGEIPRLHKGGAIIPLSPETLLWFATADTASKDKTQHDYTCMCVWAVSTVTWDLMLVDMFHDKILIPQIMPVIQNLIAPYPVSFVMIEDAASGIAVIQEAQTVRGQGITVMPYTPGTNDKVSRATEAMVRMANGQIWFPLSAKIPSKDVGWMSLVREQLVGFNTLEHDDVVDNFSMAAYYVSNHFRLRNGNNPLPQTAMEGLFSHGGFAVDSGLFGQVDGSGLFTGQHGVTSYG
jgi:predicted phage terminase large subunit-like protein